jgi:hypothetical protein
MNQCPYCYGSGEDSFEEDGKWFYQPCLYCHGAGKLNEEEMFYNQLELVASTLANLRVNEMERAANSDPDGEDFAFRAAEHMLRPYEYRQHLYEDYKYQYLDQIMEMDCEQKRVLIAWSKYLEDEYSASREKRQMEQWEKRQQEHAAFQKRIEDMWQDDSYQDASEIRF